MKKITIKSRKQTHQQQIQAKKSRVIYEKKKTKKDSIIRLNAGQDLKKS